METLIELLIGNSGYMTAALMTIMGAISAAIGAASAIAGGIKAGQSAADAKLKLGESEAKQAGKYLTDYNQDFTNRSDYLNYMRQLSNKMKQQQENNNRMNIVQGATPEVLTAQNQTLANAYANATSEFAKKASDKRDAIKDKYYNTQKEYDKMWMGIDQQEMKNWSNLATNGLGMIGNGFSAIGGDTEGLAGLTADKTYGSNADYATYKGIGDATSDQLGVKAPSVGFESQSGMDLAKGITGLK